MRGTIGMNPSVKIFVSCVKMPSGEHPEFFVELCSSTKFYVEEALNNEKYRMAFASCYQLASVINHSSAGIMVT